MVDTKMTKSAGEHWVCSILSRLDWGVALTRDGLERTDILAVKTDASRRMIEVQVKSARDGGDRTNWPLGEKSQDWSRSDREWFVFVTVPTTVPGEPRAYVIPRDHVSAAAWITYHHWRFDPAIPSGQRNTPRSGTRVHEWTWKGYENRWDLLDADASEAPVLLPTSLRDSCLKPYVGLPPEHPWQASLPEW